MNSKQDHILLYIGPSPELELFNLRIERVLYKIKLFLSKSTQSTKGSHLSFRQVDSTYAKTYTMNNSKEFVYCVSTLQNAFKTQLLTTDEVKSTISSN